MCNLCTNGFLRCAVMCGLCPTIFFRSFLGHVAVMRDQCPTKNFSFFEVTWPICLCAVMRDLCPTKNLSFFWGHMTNLPMRCYAQPMSYQKFSILWRLRDQFAYALLCATYVLPKISPFSRSHDQFAYALLCATYVLPKISLMLLCADSVLPNFLEFLEITWHCCICALMGRLCPINFSEIWALSCTYVLY